MSDPNGRFIIGPESPPLYPFVVLTDIKFWAAHETELDQWCEENGTFRTGMIVALPGPLLALFVLKWS